MGSDDFLSYEDSLDIGIIEGEPFANLNNLEHCIKYINQCFATYGLPPALDLLSQNPVSAVRICNSIYSILQQRQHDIQFRENANDQRQRLLSDLSRLESKVERLESQLAAKERELAAMTSKEQKALANFKLQIEKLQQERDEFQKMVVATQQVRTQQSHELKRKEKEYLKLQERLNQILMERRKESKAGMEIMSLLQKEGRQRGTWNSKKADEEFYKMIVDAYETKKQELMAENSDLRTLLRSMQRDMSGCLNFPGGTSTLKLGMTTENDEHGNLLGGQTDIFDLPFHMAKDQIEHSFQTKMALLKEHIIQLQAGQKHILQRTDQESSIGNSSNVTSDNVSHDGHRDMDAAKSLESEWSSLKCMASKLDTERLEMKKTKERLQEEKSFWGSNLKVQISASKSVQQGSEKSLQALQELKHNLM